jgi:glycosyltransferase involved in cell wall biosynthesis
MPVFNDKKFLSQALESLISQTYTNFELIISDDFSTDGSEMICREYANKDTRIRYIRQVSNIGISKNMMFLLKEAKGDYFMWAANDDIWDKTFIEKLLMKLEYNKKAVVAFCPYTFIDENNSIINENIIIEEKYQGFSAFIRLKCLIKKMSDGFGYGLFRRVLMNDVKFPTWWSVNKKTAYNNIYPTLFFYLSRGEYEFYDEEILWYNRIKSKENIKHSIPYRNNFYKAYFAFVLRRFNLAVVSIINVYKGSKNLILTFRIMPYMLFSIFFFRSFYNLTKKRQKFKDEGNEIFI